MAESGTLTFNALGAGVISTSDLDGDNLSVTLTANHAGIALAQSTGLTFVDSVGSDGTLEFSGSQADINAALDGLVYTSQGGYNGAATLAMLVSDSLLNHSATVNVSVSPGSSTFVWDGGGATNNWSDATNWNHDLVPEADDIVVFDVTSTKSATVDDSFAGTVTQLQIDSGYTGTINQQRDLVVNGSFTQASGGYMVGSTLLDINGDFIHTGGVANFGSGQVRVAGDFTSSASLFTLTSTLTLDGTSTQTINASGLTINDLQINNNSTINITGSANVAGDLTITNAGTIDGGPINVAGDVTTTDLNVAGTSTVVLNGVGNQIVSAGGGSGSLSNLTVNKGSGVGTTLTDTIRINGNLTHTDGVINATALDLRVLGDLGGTIDGSIGPISSLYLSANGTKTIAGTLIVNGITTLNNVSQLDGGTLRALGNVNTYLGSHTGTTTLEIAGSNNQTILSGSGNGTLRNVVVNKSGGIATFANNLNVRGGFTYVAGSTDFGSTTTRFQNSGLLLNTGSMVLANAEFASNATFSLQSDLRISGDLHLAGLSGISYANGNSITIGGDLSSSDAYVVGEVEMILNGLGNQTISGSDLLDGTLTINKASGTVSLTDALMVNGTDQQVVVQAGTLDLNGQTITTPGAVSVAGGTLTGSGAITNDLQVNNSGVVSLNAASSSSYQSIAVGGSLTLDGTSQLALDVTGWTAGGPLNDLLTSTSVTGTFGGVALAGNTIGLKSYVTYDSPAGAVDVLLNSAPTTTIGNFSVGEDSGASSVNLRSYFADLEHADSLLTFSLDGRTNPALFSAFTLNSNGGLSLTPAADANGTTDITVTVSDPVGDSITTTFSITILASNDAPVITSQGGAVAASISVNETVAFVTTVAATDVDLPAPTISYSLAGIDAGDFSIDASGNLTFSTVPDFESPADDDNDNVYIVDVVASDGTLTDTQTLTVTVVDVSATALVVTTTSNLDDTGLSGSYTIEQLNAVNGGTDGSISLREAITAANYTSGVDAITFALSTGDAGYTDVATGTDYWTINASPALPLISEAVTIDARSQAGYASSPVVQLQGAGSNGFNLSNHTGTTIAGFAINGFTNGVRISGGGSHQIVGNFIGVEVDGQTAGANLSSGINVNNSDNNVIGAVGITNRNVIAGGGSYGIYVASTSDGTITQNNLIGTDASGALDRGFSQGVFLAGDSTIIGSDGVGANSVAESNVIAGSNSNLVLSGDNNLVAGNTIGVAGMNQGTGVIFSTGAANNTIGGAATGAGNTFAGHTNDVIRVFSGATQGGQFLGNLFVDNDGQLIDLGSNGIDINDGEIGTGANGGMDHPTITTANLIGTTLVLDGFVGQMAGDTDFANARVEFFKSVGGDATQFLGFLTTDANGSFSGSLAVSGLTINDNLIATATSSTGLTSEFGVARDANAPVIIANNTNVTLDEGSTGNAIVTTMLSSTDADSNNADLTYTVTEIPTRGTLRLNGTAIAVNGTFTQGDIDNGLVTYDHDGSESSSDTFDFSVSDNNGSTATGTFSGVVTSINDAPSGADATLTTDEDTDLVFTASHFGFADVDGNTLAGIRLTTLPTNGAIYLDSSADGLINGAERSGLPAGTVVSVADINAGWLKFKPASDINGNGVASFSFQVVDNGGTANGGVNTDPTPNTMTVNVTSVVDNPSGVVVQSSSLLVSDDFNDGNYNGWTVPSGVSALSGQLDSGSSLASGRTAIWNAPTAMAWTDISITADITIGDDGLQGLVVRYQDASNYVYADLAQNGGNMPQLRIVNVVDGVQTQVVNTAAVDLFLKPTMNLTLTVVGDVYSFEIDGQQRLSATIAGHTSGTAGMIVTSQPHSLFDNVKVTTAQLSVNENSANGTVIGYAKGYDRDPGDTLTYSMTSNASGRFAINPTTGAITVASGENLNYEAGQSYTVSVVTTDSSNRSVSESQTIFVNNVNEAPVTSAPASASVAEGGALTFDTLGAGVISAFDEDGDILTATLSANHAGIALAQTTGLTFTDSVGSDGTLSFSGSQADINAALDGLVYTSQGGYNGAATLTTLVSDGSLNHTATVNIAVSPGSSLFVWDGGGATNNWSDAGNWNHDSVPEANDTVVFDVTSSKNATIDGSFAGAVTQVQIDNGYTGAITQGRGLSVSSDFTQEAGTYSFIGQTLNIDGSFTQTGGNSIWGDGRFEIAGDFVSSGPLSTGTSTLVFDGSGNQAYTNNGFPFANVQIAKTGGVLTMNSDLDLIGNLIHTSGAVDFTGTEVTLLGSGLQTLDAAGLTLDDFRINSPAGTTITINTGLNIAGNLMISAATVINGGDINVAGDVLTLDTSVTGTSTVVLNGTAQQTVSAGGGSGGLNNLEINKAGGTATLVDTLTISGSLTHTTGTVNASGLNLRLDSNNEGTIDGAIGPMNSLLINAIGTKTIDGDLSTGAFTLSALNTLNGGKIIAEGDVSIANSFYTGTTAIELGGSADQTITASPSGVARHLIINKSGGTATFENNIDLEGNITYLAGNADFSDSMVTFRRNGLILDVGELLFNEVTFTNNASLMLLDDLNIAGNLHLASLSSNSFGNGHVIAIGGNLSSGDSTVNGSVEMVLNGTGNQTISGSDLFDGTLTINKSSGIVSLTDDLELNGSGQQVIVQAGTLDLNEQTITTPGSVSVAGGTLMGGGAVSNTLSVQSGSVALSALSSSTHQQISVGGALTVDVGASLDLDVAGMTNGGAINNLITSGGRTGSFQVNLINDEVGFTAHSNNVPESSLGLFLNTAPTGTLNDVTVLEDTTPTTINLWDAFSDLQHTESTLTFSVVGNTNPTLFSTTNVNNTSGILTFTHAANANGFTDLTIQATDPYSQSTTATFRLTVTPSNDAPVESGIEGTPLTYLENAGPVAITSTITISDIDDTNIESAVVAISTNYANGQDVLTFVNHNGITGAWDAATGQLTLTGSATLTQYEAALRNVAYTNSSEAPSTATRTVSFRVNDGQLNSNTLVRDIVVDAINDDPTNLGSLPSQVTVTEDVLSNVNLSAIQLSDVDAGNSLLSLRLTTSTGGNLASASSGGVTVVGSGTSSLQLNGSLVNLNAFLNETSNIRYRHSSANFNGSDADTITVVANDGGNTGNGGGANQALGSVGVDISAVNDSPTIAAPSVQNVYEEVPTTVSGIVISDPDAAGNSVIARLQVSNGALDVTLTGLTQISAGAVGTGDLTLQGTVADINATLTSLTYTGNTDLVGLAADALSVTVNDLGNDGTGGPLQQIQSVQINIFGIDDAPLAAADFYETSSLETLVVDAPGVLVNDVDIDSSTLTAVLLSPPAQGTLTLSSDGSFTYVPNIAFSGTVTFTYQAFDGVNLSTPTTVSIDVRAAAGSPVIPEYPELGHGDDASQGDTPVDLGSEGNSTERLLAPPAKIVLSPPGVGVPFTLLLPTTDGTWLGDDPQVRKTEFEITESQEANEELSIIALSDERYLSIPYDRGTERAQTTLLSLTEQTVDYDLDLIEQWLQANQQDEQNNQIDSSYVVGTATSLVATLSAGYLMWALRGTYLLAAMAGSLPAWVRFDPIYVLDTPLDSPVDAQGSRKSLADLVTSSEKESI